MLFFNFCFFYLSEFQLAIVKYLMEKPAFFVMHFAILVKFYYVKNIFDLHTFGNEAKAFLNLYKISTEIHYVSLFFLNERNVKTSLFDDTYKMY